MISQEKRLIITFRCTTDAIAMEKSCKATGAPGRLIPIPRSISASCGLSWCAPLEKRPAPLRNSFKSRTWNLRAFMNV